MHGAAIDSLKLEVILGFVKKSSLKFVKACKRSCLELLHKKSKCDLLLEELDNKKFEWKIRKNHEMKESSSEPLKLVK